MVGALSSDYGRIQDAVELESCLKLAWNNVYSDVQALHINFASSAWGLFHKTVFVVSYKSVTINFSVYYKMIESMEEKNSILIKLFFLIMYLHLCNSISNQMGTFIFLLS